MANPVRSTPTRPPTPRQTAILVSLAFAAFIVAVIIAPAAAARLADWLWFREIGYERVFFTKILAQWALGAVAWVLAFAVLYANARLALKGIEVLPEDRTLRLGAAIRYPATMPQMVPRLARPLAAAASALFALLVALGVAGEWQILLQFIHRTPFGVVDPVFSRDVGYYVFTLPALSLLIGVASSLLVMSLIVIALPIHALRGHIAAVDKRLAILPPAQQHFALIAALFLLVEAFRIHFLAVPSLLLGQHTVLAGATYTDLHARLPSLRILSLVAVVGSGLILYGARQGRLVRSASRVVIAYVVIWVVAMVLGPQSFQRLTVQPNELTREAPQIVHHLKATRDAWGIASVERRELSTGTRITPEIIAANRATIDNVRLWDREPLLQTFGQIQSIRTYYDFVSVDDDRYLVNGAKRQVMLSARELSTAALPTKGFINEHLTYTHGMGVTLGPTNQVTPEGLPVLFIKDLPPVSSIDLKITRPQIYFGELANDFVLAPTAQKEFDYPAGEGDAASYSSYDGRGGVPINSLARRLVYAIRFGAFNLLLASDLTDRTKILYYRDVRERAGRALPFLRFDRDPYIIINAAGQLKWMLDAYTVTDRYPYSRAAGGVNYMRNSAKVVIDAYDGDVTAYLADATDPIVRTATRIYPGLLKPMETMPADLKAHVRYPEDFFGAQSTLYATYHMEDAETFYHREDQWQIPRTPTQTDNQSTFLRHMVMRLPGEAEPEFIFMRPFTPRQKDNLAAWMVARNDGEHYGKLVVYRFPRQSLVFGPNQIVNRINQDTEVSRQITLWDQRGSEVVRGELLVLPVEQSLIYVQPLYLRAAGGRIPELKRVVVAHEGRVAMEETLEAALQRLFGSASERAVAATPGARVAAVVVDTSSTDVASLSRRAREHYDKARAAQRADDWATYGSEMRLLGEVLRQLEAVRRP